MNKVSINTLAVRALEHNPVVLAKVAETAELIAEAARSIAPVKTGSYKASIGVDVFDDGRVRVIAKDFKSNWIEFGTVKWPPHATLRSACDIVGLPVHASGA